MAKMTEADLIGIIKGEVQASATFVGGQISEQRRKSMEYYLGEPFGNENEDESSAVMTDVQDVIESAMPSLMEIFGSGEEAVRFEPVGLEDEEAAKQATQYVNHIWFKASYNDGFGTTYDWIKDSLLQKQGYLKIWWEDHEHTRRETLTNVNLAKLVEFEEDPQIEIIEQEAVEVPPELFEFAPDGLLFDITIKHTETKGRCRIVCIPPEEFLISRRATSLDEATFTCHKVKKTVTELLEMGYSKKVVEALPSHDEQNYNEERVARYAQDEEWPDQHDETRDPSMREIWLYECYLKVDFDGDGLGEMRAVTTAGPGHKILQNELVDDHPFIDMTPIRMPHKHFGRSLADLVMDIQLIRSTVLRQLLTNMYGVNSNRYVVNERVNLDDMLTNRPGGLVRVEGGLDPSSAVMPLTTQSLGAYAFPVLEYMDTVRETRTGITKYNQGLDSDSLNKTASGINQIMGQAQARQLLIARLMAETGFKKAFKKILRLLINHQTEPDVIRLRNQWVPMDPRSWNAEMDMTVTVGLGHGTKEQQVMLAQRMIEMQVQAIQLQGGIQGPLVDGTMVHNALKKWTVSAGLKDPDAYWLDPADPQQQQQQQEQQQQPDPAMIEAQGKMQIAQAELQGKQQNKQAELSQEMQIEQAKLQQEHALKIEEMRMNHEYKMQQLELKRQEVEATVQIKDAEAQARLAASGVIGPAASNGGEPLTVEIDIDNQ
jgi:hypothetical protein|tara:strand:- start:145 stop:2289 length:2145 start_codon:yes stop_codon:yes gene_type:complete